MRKTKVKRTTKPSRTYLGATLSVDEEKKLTELSDRPSFTPTFELAKRRGWMKLAYHINEEMEFSKYDELPGYKSVEKAKKLKVYVRLHK